MPVFECARCNGMTYSASAGTVGSCAVCGSDRQRVIEGGFHEARSSQRTLEPGDHAALTYEDPAAVAPFCACFLTDGVNSGDRVVSGLEEDLREEVRELLAAHIESAVEWEDPRSLYGDFDADRVASSYETLISAESRTTRILAGPDAASAEEMDVGEYERYERRAHGIITANDAIVVCVFRAGSLQPRLLEAAAHRHGLAVEDGAVRRNDRFEYQPA